MHSTNRFQDENLVLAHFYNEVWVVCPACSGKAVAKTNTATKTARLFCVHCGYNKEVSTSIGKNEFVTTAANYFFEVALWLKANFKDEVFWAYNHQHLIYLEQYIAASLREHKDRSHFTLLEKLPKFYHQAKNRSELLKIIQKLKSK